MFKNGKKPKLSSTWANSQRNQTWQSVLWENVHPNWLAEKTHCPSPVHGVAEENNQKYKAKAPKKSRQIFDCGVCGKTFATPHRLTSHKIIYTTVKPFPCKICDRSFNYLGTLSRHRKAHNSEKNWNKNIFCQIFKYIEFEYITRMGFSFSSHCHRTSNCLSILIVSVKLWYRTNFITEALWEVRWQFCVYDNK